jgi:hypothetical protein
MAALRNLVVTVLRLTNATSTALRYHARRPSRPSRPLQTIMNC